MDKILPRYTSSLHQDEFISEEEQSMSLPPLSLKFTLPPLDNVSREVAVIDL